MLRIWSTSRQPFSVIHHHPSTQGQPLSVIYTRPNVRKHYTPSSVYTDVSPVTPKRGRGKTRAPQTARPVVTPIPGYGYRRGPHTYTEKEFQAIFMLGVKAKGLMERRERRRNHARGIIEKCKKDLQELIKDEDKDINVLMDDEPLNGLGLQIEQLNNDSLI